jgi:phosphoribosylformylglycinamidine synthase subunit PurQ / glutaminase
MPIPVLILHAPGTNRDGDAAFAIQKAGGDPQIWPLTQLRRQKKKWLDFGMLVLPGGFSYGDALGAGRLWALDLQTWFNDQAAEFAASQRPVIGICNGFQALVKAGILPGEGQTATLTFNASGLFECRWVALRSHTANCSPWLAGLSTIACPIAHGEGRFLMKEGSTLASEQIALTYMYDCGEPARGAYPANPNGSPDDIAGITNRTGNVLGLMPHPEDHVLAYQNPGWTRNENGGSGLGLFKNGIQMLMGD